MRTVIVTGASRGIGEAIARAFAVNGYNTLVNYNKSIDSALKFIEDLKKEGLSVEGFKADVSNRYEAEAMINYCISKFGCVDVLINNAGIAQTKLFIDLTETDWDNMIKVNLNSVFYCTQPVVKYMLKRKSGKIINISSIWGITGASCEVHYSTVKAGIIGFTKALSKELGPSNIQVNCIAPGVIQTDMIKNLNENEVEELKNSTPLLRLGTADDVAECALFLASNKADFITGQVISPNGGFVI